MEYPLPCGSWLRLAAARCTWIHGPSPSRSWPGRVCTAFGIDPLGAIASGALLLASPEDESEKIILALEEAGIPCASIGSAEKGPAEVIDTTTGKPLPHPIRDEIARVFEK